MTPPPASHGPAALAVAVLALGITMINPDLAIRTISRISLDDALQVTAGNTSKLRETLLPPPAGIIASVEEGAPFVLVLTPANRTSPLDADALAILLEANVNWFRDCIFHHGAIIFRGFHVPNANAFEQVALAISRDLATTYLGTSPRSSINGTTFVHTAADFSPHRTVPVHMEMSFRDRPPQTQMFYAHRLDHSRGGETPLTDFEGVWQTLRQDAVIREKYSNAGLQYIRNNDDCGALSRMDPLVQKCWQEMFKTSDRQQVLMKCKEEQFNCTFLDDWHGRVRMTNVQPFVRKHPVTGKSVWFNHINVLTRDSMVEDYERTSALWGGLWGWWPLALSIYYRALFGILSMFLTEMDFGSAVAFADGMAIPVNHLVAFKRAIWKNTVQRPYELHDIVVVDNLRIGHGREIYTGGKGLRTVLTALSDEYPSKWFSK